MFTGLLNSELTMAQRPDIVVGKFEMPLNDALSIIQLKELLVKNAKSAALQKEYGTGILKMETMATTDLNNNSATEKYWAVTETSIFGVWLCDIEPPTFNSFIGSDGKSYLQAIVKGYAKPKEKMKAQVQAAILSCPEPTCDDILYYENSSFHIYFQSTTPGLLIVFAEDLTEQMVYGIGTPNSSILFSVSPNQPIIYPNPLSNEYNHEIQFALPEGEESAQQLFRFIFSNQTLQQPYELFEYGKCNSEIFRKWLLKQIISNENILVETVAVTILK